MPRFRTSSLGAGAIILAVFLLILHRYGTSLLFLVVGVALLWYARLQREAQERAADGTDSDRPTESEDGEDRGGS